MQGNNEIKPVEETRKIISDHIVRLSARLAIEKNEMEREIIQARIDNMVIAQKQLQASFMVPGHG